MQQITLAGEDLGVFDFASLTLKELFAIKAATGLNGKAFGVGIEEMDPQALGGLVWFMKYKRGEHVAIETLDFAISDLKATEIEAPKAQDETLSMTSETGTSDS